MKIKLRKKKLRRTLNGFIRKKICEAAEQTLQQHVTDSEEILLKLGYQLLSNAKADAEERSKRVTRRARKSP